MTLEDEWKRYRTACYPSGISKSQEVETRQAFFAGALIAMTTVSNVANEKTEAEAGKFFGEMIREAHLVCQHRMVTLKGRN